jgi:hypothetical protein
MATITEDYVSFEIAKLLKEKGFDEPTTGTYYNGTFEHHNANRWNSKFIIPISAPTLQMVMKWLREVHGLFISIGNDDLDYNWQIFDIKNRTKDLDPTCLTESYAGYIKYEQAAEAAIKYCLENLI